MKSPPGYAQQALRFVVALAIAAGLSACERKISAEEVGRKIDQSVEKAAVAADKKLDAAGAALREQAAEARQAARAAASDASSAIRETAKDVRQATREATSEAGRTISDKTADARNAVRDSTSGASSAIRESTADARKLAGDAALTAKVKAALMREPGLRSLAIDVDTTNGIVTLNGTVDSAANLDRALQVAIAVEGVKIVNNNLSVKQS